MSYKRLSPAQINCFVMPVKQLFARGYVEEALGKATSLSGSLPYYEEPWYWLAQIQLQLSLLPEAILSLQRLLALAPQNASARFQLGFIYQLQGQTAAAAEQYELAAELRPECHVYQDALSELSEGASQNTLIC